MKKLTLSLALLLLSVFMYAGGSKDSTANSKKHDEDKEKAEKLLTLMKTLDSAENATHYEIGSIAISNGIAHLNLPVGYKFINASQSQYVLEHLWQNLPDASILGMIVNDSFHLNKFEGNNWAFVVRYDEMGYVKDEDADKIDYKELLENMKKDNIAFNNERKKLGYGAMYLQGWASTPYYDKQNKVLHWAKEFNVEGEDGSTLNYDVRVLGRKGVLSLNAVATMDELAEVKKNIPNVLKMAQFDKGNTYAEYDSKVDKVAAWTIGGLVAGKVLAKVGFFAVILKFWKFILLGVAGAGAAIKRFFTGKKKEDEYTPEPPVDSDNASPAV